MSSSSLSSDQICTSYFSKMGEQITDYTQHSMKEINDLKLNVESLKKRFRLLNDKASGAKKRKWEIEEWLARFKSIEREVFELGTLAESVGSNKNLMNDGKIAKLNEEVVMLVEQSGYFDELYLDTCGTRGVELLTTRMVGEAFVDNMTKVWSFLETKSVSSIAIYGMGGVGKSALAKCINNRLLKQSQVRMFWIGASEGLTIKSLQDKIASFVGLNLSDECDEELRAARLHRALCQMKNIVLILDDLWKYIDLIKVGCPVCVEHCRILITTRSLEVCHQLRCQKVIRVRTLHESEAWKLFIESLTLGEKIELAPDEEEIAKSAAKLCGGLPLGIINVAESMRGKASIHSWTTAVAELTKHVTMQGGIGDVEVFRVLKYSFDRLNTQSEELNLQLCFIHCSFYPPGDVLDKDRLVEEFISEGLVDGRMSRKAQVHQGHSILDKLLNVCLLEAHDVRVKTHSLVRGMALKVGEGKYLVRAADYSLKEIPQEREWTECLEKVSLMDCGIRIIRDGTSPSCPKLSTLLLRNNPLEAIPDSFFSKMKQLSTLDLCDTRIKMLPDSVSDLTSLEALLLQCKHLEKVPYLGKLKALRELNLSYSAIKEVPQGVEELFNLKFLSLDAPVLVMLPMGLLLELRRLQYVTFPLQVQVEAEEIENLKEEEHFSGRLKDVRAFNCLIKNQQLDGFCQVLVGENSYVDEDVFGLQSRQLSLSKCCFDNEKVCGGEIKDLRISECEGMSKCFLDDFSLSHNPKVLTIRRCKGIECILTCSRESQSGTSQSSGLVVIYLEHLHDFKGMVLKRDIGVAAAATPSRAVFSALTTLEIFECNKMRKLGLPASGLPNIEDITIVACRNIEEVFEDEGRGSVVLPKLQELKLEDLPRLKVVSKATMVCDSITTIYVLGCPRLAKKMPVHLGIPLPPRLRSIEREEEWWESLECVNPRLFQLLQPFLP